jgi:hypothetical protein
MRVERLTFDRLVRRSALLPLGIAGLGTLAPGLSEAKKKGKGKKGDPNERCKKQVNPCVNTLSDQCDDGDEECLEHVRRCCGFLRTCNVTGLFNCLSSSGTARLLRR